MKEIKKVFLLLSAIISFSSCNMSDFFKDSEELTRKDTKKLANTTPVYRKGVTLAGELDDYIINNFALLQQILDSGAGVIGVNLPWYEATMPCDNCDAVKPSDPRDWNDSLYASTAVVKKLDKISNYVKNKGNGAFIMVIAWGTPGWAACPDDLTDTNDIRLYPPQKASDYGDFMYAMSERYRGSHTNDDGLDIGKVRDWVIYNEVNTPDWWHNTSCNSSNYDPVFYYGEIMNEAYDAIHHLPSSLEVRALAGGFTSYHHSDYIGNPGLRLTTSYKDWNSQTNALHNGQQNHAWISPLDFVSAMENYDIRFDAIALHPYPVQIHGDPMLSPPAGAVGISNLGEMLDLLQTLYPDDRSKWHLCLTEYHQQSYYGNNSEWPHTSTIQCPNYFCSETTEVKLNSFLESAYGTNGSNKPNVDYLIWTMWKDVEPYSGGIIRGDGSDKTENLSGSSIRHTYTQID